MRKKTLYPLAVFAGVFILQAAYSIWKDAQISKQWAQVEDTNLLSLYLARQDYFLGFSYALAGAFTVYAFLRFLEGRKRGATGVLGGVTLTGLLYLGGCFLLGCCGSPMLAVYLGLFGSSFLGFAKPLVLMITTASVSIGYLWLEKKTSKSCCQNEKYTDEDSMKFL